MQCNGMSPIHNTFTSILDLGVLRVLNYNSIEYNATCCIHCIDLGLDSEGKAFPR